MIKIFDKELLATPSGKFTIIEESPLIGTWKQILWLEDGLWWNKADDDAINTYTSDHRIIYGSEVGYWEANDTHLKLTDEEGSLIYTYEIKDNYLYLKDYSDPTKPYIYIWIKIDDVPAELLGTWQNTGEGYQYMEITETTYRNYNKDENGEYGEEGVYSYGYDTMIMQQFNYDSGEFINKYTVRIIKLTETDLELRYEEYNENGNLIDSYGYSYKKLK